MPSEAGGDETVLSSRVRLPEHVVHRDFAEETVILNLDSGTYHGLNGTAARMLQVLTASDSVGAALEQLTREYEQPAETIERDLLDLCRALSERGLIEQDAGRTG